MRIKFITGLLIMLPLLGFSQGEWNQWCFGGHAAMTFNFGNPQGVLGSALIQSACGTSATVSDSLGNLLFSSNGWKVWNKNNTVMPNGNGILGGNLCQQPVFAVPKPGNRSQYYLFTVGEPDAVGFEIGLHYSVIDMSLQGGLGDVLAGMKNIPVDFGDVAIDQLTGVRHFNNKDVWIVVLKHGTNSDIYLSYLVTAAGISTPPVISSSNLPSRIYWRPSQWYHKRGGDMKISWDGKNLVCTDSLTEICYFNPMTGIVTPRFLIYPSLTGNPVIGAEFSVDSKFLYLCMSGGTGPQWENKGWQFDMTSPDSLSFIQSQVLLGGGFGSKLQLAPDWKIYVGANPFIDSLHCINNPSLPGLACNYQNNAVSLVGNTNNQCLVQFLQKYKAYIHDSGLCFLDSTHFWGDVWPPADTTWWNFGDPASGGSNVSYLSTPAHLFSNPGTYTVELYVRHNDNRTDTTWHTITIYPRPVPIISGYPSAIAGSVYTYTTIPGMTNYQWTYSSGGMQV